MAAPRFESQVALDVCVCAAPAAPDSADALAARRRASANVEQPGAQASPMPTSPVAHQPNLDQAGPAL